MSTVNRNDETLVTSVADSTAGASRLAVGEGVELDAMSAPVPENSRQVHHPLIPFWPGGIAFEIPESVNDDVRPPVRLTEFPHFEIDSRWAVANDREIRLLFF